MLQNISVCFQWPPLPSGGSTRHSRDMVDGSKSVRRLADALAKEQLRNPEFARNARNELVVKYIDARREATGEKMDEIIVPAAAEHFKVSEKTIWNALTEAKTKREREAAHAKNVLENS